MLCRKFELILIKIEFFINFLKLLKKTGQGPWTGYFTKNGLSTHEACCLAHLAYFLGNPGHDSKEKVH